MFQSVTLCPKPESGSSVGCILPPQVTPVSAAAGVSWWDELCCSFLEEDYTRTNCMVEEDIYNVLDQVMEEEDVVLEIGSRYGTISCALSQSMGNNGKLVTVEADPSAWEIHQYNKLTHSCSSYSGKPLATYFLDKICCGFIFGSFPTIKDLFENINILTHLLMKNSTLTCLILF